MKLRPPSAHPVIGAALASPALLFVSGVLHAAPLGASVHVERSERAGDCPDAAELTRKVELILQRALAAPDASDELEVSVSFDADHAQYSANVSSRGPKPGERNLTDRGPNCTALADAVSVAIALLLDKELARPVDGNAEPSPAPQELPAPSRSRTGTSNAPPPQETNHLEFALREAVEGGPGFGLVGTITPLLSERASAKLGEHALIELGFHAALPGATEHGSGSVRTTLLFGDARACYAFGAGVSFGPCAALGLGRLRGVGIGYENPSAQNLTWFALGAGAVLEAPLWGRVFGGVSAFAWVPTRRSVFGVERGGIAWESSTVGGSLLARLGCRIF